MSLPLPNLDDRTFNQLVEDARRQIAQRNPDWNDLSPHDPGMVLLELFAYLTETLIYRLNQLPEKSYIAFLGLLGVSLYPPAAASTMVTFRRSQPSNRPVEIPKGTRLTVSRPGNNETPPVFMTARHLTIPAGQPEGEVLARHCQQVDGELAGRSSGLPSQRLTLRHSPLIAATGDELDLLVGVEILPGELSEGMAARQFNQKSYRLWHKVENFTNLGPERAVFRVDPISATIIFAPAGQLTQADGSLADSPQPLADLPPAGREIRVWYCYGGGSEGNVAANSLTVLKDPIPGLEVTNLRPAVGGRPAETLANALVRGPQELHSLQRAITARDFELLALNHSPAIARAKAFTHVDLWRHASAGTVELLLVPYLPESERNNLTVEWLGQYESAVARQQIAQILNERRPMAINCLVNWAHYKRVRVTARIVVGREEEQTSVKRRVLERLYQAINPLPTPFNQNGWPFGQPLQASDVYKIALAEPGVRWVDKVGLLVDEVPNQKVSAIAADYFQEQTWFAGSGPTVFRSMNDGEGWEAAGRFPDEMITTLKPHPQRAGLVALVTSLTDGGSRLYFSKDCGESWQSLQQFAFGITDLAWTLREGTPLLLLATNKGLYELLLRPGSSPVQLMVDRADQDKGFYAVATATDVRGITSVAVAAQNLGGVYLSNGGGRSETFRPIKLGGEDIRQLAIQTDGPRLFLWAGAAAMGGNDPGKGCFRWELRGLEEPPEGWRLFTQGWQGGSCRGIAFVGNRVLAASHRAGILRLDLSPEPTWVSPDVRCGLPLRDPGRFHPVDALAGNGNRLLVGGIEGVYGSRDSGNSYQSLSGRLFTEKVTLPKSWLFVSGEHEIQVVSEDEAR